MAALYNIRMAFEAGFKFGDAHGEASAAEADEMLRDAGMDTTDGMVTAFCNGTIDGANGDRFRLNAGRKAQVEIDRANEAFRARLPRNGSVQS